MKDRPSLLLVVLLVVTVVLGIAAAVIGSGRQPQAPDLDTPDGVSQAFLAATLRGDLTDAADLLSEGSRCDSTDLARSWLPQALRVEVLDVRVDGDEATVVIEVAEIEDNGPFASSEWAHTERHVLRLEDEGWRLRGTPWPLYDCWSADR